MIFNTERNDELIARREAARRKMGKRTWAHKKETDRLQENDHTRINNYSEGYCYVCSVRDLVAFTTLHICNSCKRKRGNEGLIHNIIEQKGEYLCDICGRWRVDVYNRVWQRNVAACHKCLNRVGEIHRINSRKRTPYMEHLLKKYGKDAELLTGTKIYAR